MCTETQYRWYGSFVISKKKKKNVNTFMNENVHFANDIGMVGLCLVWPVGWV